MWGGIWFRTREYNWNSSQIFVTWPHFTIFQGKIEIDFMGFGFPIIDDSTVTQPLI
jgi:hypothetical protein